MNLATHIKSLLYRYDCVIVPGFGAFLTQKTPTNYNAKTHAFTPPGKTLSFNKLLQTNDGILAHQVALDEAISYELALLKIREFVSRLNTSLYEGKTVALEQIGLFSLTSENKLQFSPSKGLNFNTESFGLTPLTAAPVLRETLAANVTALEAKTPLYFTPARRQKHYLKYAAAIALVVAVSGFSFVAYKNHLSQRHSEIAQQDAETKLQKTISEATFTISKPLPTLTLTLENNSGHYHIVAGAFRFPENALKKLNELHAKNFPARNIGVNKYGLHQIVYGSFHTRKEALKALRDIRKKENEAAWLFIKRLP